MKAEAIVPIDFRDAAERHWEDAGYLLADARLANADHLFGLSAECALKAIMLALGEKGTLLTNSTFICFENRGTLLINSTFICFDDSPHR